MQNLLFFMGFIDHFLIEQIKNGKTIYLIENCLSNKDKYDIIDL